MKKILPFLMALSLAPVFADDPAVMPQFTVPTAYSNGFGGPHVAYTDNVFSLLVNPGAMIRVEERSFFTISATLLSPQTTIGFIDKAKTALDGDYGPLMEHAGDVGKNGKIPLGIGIQELPLSIAWVADGFGFGLWNRVFINPSVDGTWIKADVLADVILPIGFAFKVFDFGSGAHTLDAGVAFKGFARLRASQQMKILDLVNDQARDAAVDSLSLPLIVGGGVDLGLMYRWNIGLSAGFTLSDIYTRGQVVANLLETRDPNNHYYVPSTMNLGVAYDLNLGRLWKSAPKFLANSGFTFAFDWRNVANAFHQDDYTRRNALLDLGAGAQFTLGNMFSIRAGMNEMLPALGLGLHFGAFQIDAAYYGKELGNEPGQLSTAALDLTIAIRPGAKKRNWAWARNPILGGKSGEE